MRCALAAVILTLALPAFARDQAAAPPSDGIRDALTELERVIAGHDLAGYTALTMSLSSTTDSEFLDEWLTPGATRTIVRERVRLANTALPDGQGIDVYADVLIETGDVGRVATLLIEFRRDPPPSGPWRIFKLSILTTVRGLYKLSLNPGKQFAVRDLTVSAEDFAATLPAGMAFVTETDEGVTGIVFLGKGEVRFSPSSAAERGQVKIYGGADVLQAGFTWVYLRMNPAEFTSYVAARSLQPLPVDPRDLRRAQAIFQENVSMAFAIDLADLSREKWSVVPKPNDVVAEIQTDRAHLTYMRSGSDPEDIRFFDRTHQRTISIYASKDRLASRGQFFDEDDDTGFDILNTEIDASLDPQREWIDGKATLLVTARRFPVGTLVLNLAEPLVIRSVVSRKLGYLMPLRVTGQNDVIINLPQVLEPNMVLDLEFTYGGRLPAVPPEREALDLAQERTSDFFTMQPIPSYIYTGRSNWYPQGQVSDYGTAQLTLRVPDGYSSVASGALAEGSPTVLPADARGQTWKEYHFSATQPVRYLGWATSKFVHVETATVAIEPAAESRLTGVSYSMSDVSVESSGVFLKRAHDLATETQKVLKFYGALLDDLPYQSFSLAVVERSTPGGHSPPYLAALSQPPPGTPIVWRTDPAYFDNYPEFFLAHEAAHQWWGQAVGWKNYHEQWLSEGFSQYFAALYAEQLKRKDVFEQIVRQMTKWTIERSEQGPVYLGYRLGHIKSDQRTFRALVYNKGALTLHMLRRLLGDEIFFEGLKSFYTKWRFRKAGTDDLRQVFEAAAKRPLSRFFERWIYGSTLPRMKFTYTVAADAVVVRFEQIGDVFDVPVTVAVQHADSTWTEVIVEVTEAVVEQRIPVTGPVKDVEANKDDAAPVIFVK